MREALSSGVTRHFHLILGACITPIALIVGFASGGGGHGSYFWARVLLPYAFLGLGDYPFAALIVTALAVAQWPVYGGLLDRATHRILTGIFLLAAHLTLSIWLLVERFR